jgi:hypothetical protein
MRRSREKIKTNELEMSKKTNELEQKSEQKN